MKFFICTFFLCCLFSLQVLAAGENCSSPIAVTAGCPAVKMTNQSSAGMGNDINSWKYNAY
ncbi:MAG: hypothetical protein JWO58_547, partial [Chitinophagaceae bacterium]|nr:hypothetical protein [Chitinophagaceae bacterium]